MPTQKLKNPQKPKTRTPGISNGVLKVELIAGGVTGQKLYNALGVGWEDISVMIRYYADLAGKSRKYVPHVQQVFHQIFA
jgi:hypothetical protein